MARTPAIAWDPEAREALKRVPALVRGLARRKVEQRVAAAGGARVSLADFAEAEARFRAVMGGRSEKELASLLPAPNRPGARMVVLETCRAGLSDCPNVLLDTEPWRAAIEAWLAEDKVSERLRARVEEDSVLFHHKLRIALSGCPNGCSRPPDRGFGPGGNRAAGFRAGGLHWLRPLRRGLPRQCDHPGRYRRVGPPTPAWAARPAARPAPRRP